MHHLVLDVVDLGLATEFVIARCLLAISPDTLYVQQFSGWCDLEPLNYKSGASSSEGNAVCHLEFSEAPSDLAVPAGGQVVEVRGPMSGPMIAQAMAGLTRDVGTNNGGDDCEARSDTTTYVGDELPRLAELDSWKSATSQRFPLPPSAPPPPLPTAGTWATNRDLLQTGLVKFSVDDTIWRMLMWMPVKMSDSLLAGEQPPIGRELNITHMALGFSPEMKAYDRLQLYDPPPMLQQMAGKAIAINQTLKELKVQMGTAPTIRIYHGIELAEAWTKKIGEKCLVYGPMVSYYAAKRWTFVKRSETELPRSL